MSMNLYVYVGPYIECEWGDVDEQKYESILCDGRMEAREKGEHMILIPNRKVPGIDRQMVFDRYSETPVVCIKNIEKELDAFHNLARPLLFDLCRSGLQYCMLWGVVPRWA